MTGAAHGFGRAISLAFAARGATVWACDVLEDEVRETQRLCIVGGGVCESRVVDVTDNTAVGAFLRRLPQPVEASEPAGFVSTRR